MDIVKTFGSAVERLLPEHPDAARRLLLTGYRLQRLRFAARPDKKLPPSRQYAARAVMDVVIGALARPEKAAAVSIFTPCEILTAAGLTPYSAETVSGYLSGAKCEKIFLEHTAGAGVPETLCSFHRIFLGAAHEGLIPKPRLMAYTNLACDGNMITFPYLGRKYGIPGYFIDMPYEKSEDAVRGVAAQLREMAAFVADTTGRRVSDDALREAVGRSARTAANYGRYLACQKERRLPGDLTSEMYAVFMSHILLGTERAERYSELLARDIRRAPESRGLRLLWLHLVPYLQAPVRQLLNFTDRAFVTACDLAYESMAPIDVSRPYEAMARRMVYSCYNGGAEGRARQAVEMAARTGADGVVIFAHWGCKATLGATQLLKHALEREGLPTLVLDGDGCNPSNCSDGQTATRMGAFLEMLEARKR